MVLGVDAPLDGIHQGGAVSKNMFQVDDADRSGAFVFRKRLKRSSVLQFFTLQPQCTVAMKAGAGRLFGRRDCASRSTILARQLTCLSAVVLARDRHCSVDVMESANGPSGFPPIVSAVVAGAHWIEYDQNPACYNPGLADVSEAFIGVPLDSFRVHLMQASHPQI